VTLRKRRTWAGTALGGAVLAAVTLLCAQGCAPGAPADAATQASHAVSVATARGIYQTYVKESDEAAVKGDQTQALLLVTSAQWAQVKAQFLTLNSTGTAVTRYTFGTPVFYVPALGSYPQWFVAVVPRSTVTDGKPGPATSTLMLFARGKKTVPWTLSGMAMLSGPLPKIALDGGYAIPVSAEDQSLLLRPDVVGATQAAVVDQGLSSPAAAVVAAGSQTTGLYAAQSTQAAAQQRLGLRYSWLFEGSSFPQVGLRLADGGALVLYGMYLNTTNEHPNLDAGSPIPVPAAFSAILTTPNEVGYHAVYANWAYQYAAIDPPASASHAKLQIIAWQSGPSYGHAY
jgi:hypothetical protein